MNAPYTRRAMSGELLSRCMGDPDAVFARPEIEVEGTYVAREFDRWAHRHEEIGAPDSWVDTAAKAVIIAGLIVSLAIWIAA